MKFNESDLEYFVNNIWDSELVNNNGGMGSADMFTLFLTLKNIRPKVIIESGVWNRMSTKIIRKTCKESIIICLDPREIPEKGYKDTNKNTIYFIGKDFKDFSNLNLNEYNADDILCFFDCHQNAFNRVMQCMEKKIKNILFNDNYPVNCGGHFTIEHLIKEDNRILNVKKSERKKIISSIEKYHIYPNIYPGKIKTMEGKFSCESYFKNMNDKYPIFKRDRGKYRWNTYIKLR